MKGLATTVFIVLLLMKSGVGFTKSIRVTDIDSYNKAAKSLQPGDTLLMTAGVWSNAALVLSATGTATQPIVLMAEKMGQVFMEGNSTLRLSGNYLVVSGLYFRNGYASKGSVIEFRENANKLAFNSRVTACVIEEYNKPDRFDEDTWIQLYGQHNRFDHNYIAGKKNGGVTMAVNLNDERNQNNYHRIDHNFFGPRPRLGSNGGETIRIGVSTYSLTSSRTILEDNYFYRCNGEVEIVSIKSCDNVVRGNRFVECEGGLVLRHGNRNRIEGNYFLGNNKPHTGGVRVINAGHSITNNYFADLKGDRFRSALTIMNAVPNSPINRYHQVKDVTIAYNTFVNCDHIELGAGKDLERIADPEGVRFVNNVFYAPKADSIFHIYTDIKGIVFSGNLLQTAGKPIAKGIEASNMKLVKNSDGLLFPFPDKKLASFNSFKEVETDLTGQKRQSADLPGVLRAGTVKDLPASFNLNSVGPGWFKKDRPVAIKQARIIPVLSTTADGLNHAFGEAADGDIIELTDNGPYRLSKSIKVNKSLTLRSKVGYKTRPEVRFEGEGGNFAFFIIENKGHLNMQGISFNGTSDSGVADCIIRTSDGPMIEHYNLFVEDCSFANLADSRKNAFRATKGTYADTVQFKNCQFYNISGDVLSLASEKDDKGIYNAEYVIIENCLFKNILTGALDLYRGGNDESTLGPFLTVDHCTFDAVGNVELGHVLKVMGVQCTDIRNSIFNNSGRAGRAIRYEDYGWAINTLSNCNFYEAGRIESFYPIPQHHITSVPAQFENPKAFDYRLKQPSILIGGATDGKDIGVISGGVLIENF
ncbi:poly(beta-D-mannuronate) lyase [Dyadobacter jejuensis]|uniref:Poly(Beta-D-mannuronate) lyase n=1 Tax=Dyadobacter jejuensis TaxID=1082580 RepID=A0A316ALK1_9BACT|nr:polysaccharide lyase 6 family protein [Dyadobacter jejuensis]PWJ58456.1 poly(beta-D-mannuronate) lyase [Dyadobacter jejuensis]